MVTPRKKVTDATKAKLPLPKGHPQKRPARKRPKGTAPNVDRHLHPEPSPIAGQPLPEGLGSAPAPTFDAVPVDWPWGGTLITSTTTSTAGYREPLYDTRPYPWDIRRWLSHKLTALAKWVSP